MAVLKSFFLTKPILSEKVPHGTTAPLPLLYSSFAVHFSHFVKNHHITTATFLTLLFFLFATSSASFCSLFSFSLLLCLSRSPCLLLFPSVSLAFFLVSLPLLLP